MVTKKIINGFVIGNVIFGLLGTVYASVSATDTTSLPISIQAVSADIGVSTPAITSNLSLGSVGSDVIALQTSLEKGGYLTIPKGIAKGYFGVATRDALKKFQRANNINPSGYFGPLTKALYTTKGMGVVTTPHVISLDNSGSPLPPQSGNGTQLPPIAGQVQKVPPMMGSSTNQQMPLGVLGVLGTMGSTSVQLPPPGITLPSSPVPFSQNGSTSSPVAPSVPPQGVASGSSSLPAGLTGKVVPVPGVPQQGSIAIPIVTKPVPVVPQPITLPVIKPTPNVPQPVVPLGVPALPPKKI